MAVYDVNGTVKKCVKGVAHRGYSTTAPENTIPAFVLAAENGYKYVECDISPTSDGVMMLLHDTTIDRTSNGTGTLSEMTYDQVRQYDFGSWKGAAYAGTVIPTLEEFLECCANYSLHPYIEFKTGGGYSEPSVRGVIDMVERCGLKGNVTYISFALDYLTMVKNYDNEARIGYLWRNEPVTAQGANQVRNLRTGHNYVFLDANIRTDEAVAFCKANDIPMEFWVATSVTTAGTAAFHSYITGLTCNSGQPSAIDSSQTCYSMNGSKLREVYNANGGLL